MNEQPADIWISALADPEQRRFASRGVLSRNQTKPSGEIAGFGELAGIADRGNQRSRTNRPDPREMKALAAQYPRFGAGTDWIGNFKSIRCPLTPTRSRTCGNNGLSLIT